MTDVGEVTVRIRADAAQLEREMQRANAVVRQSAGGMGASFGGFKAHLVSLASALSTVGFVQFGKHAVDAAGHMVDLADRIGFTASTLSALQIPLAASGSNLDEFSAAVNKMNNLIGEAAKGNEEAVKAFDALGLSVAKLRTLSPEEQFYEIAQAVGQIKDQSTQTEAGMNVFGRGFAAMLPLLKEYEGDMRKAVGAQKELGDALDDDTLQRIDAFGDALSAAGIKIENAFLRAFAAILKVIDEIPAVDALADQTASRYGTDSAAPTTGNTKFGVTPASGPHTQYPLEEVVRTGTGAKGDNKSLLGAKDAADAAKARAKQIRDATAALDDYNRSLREEGALLGLSDRDAAAQEARFRVEEIARKGNITLTQQQIDASAELAAQNYDLKAAQDEVNKAIQEATRFQQELHDKLSSTLTDIAFKAGSATEAMLGFAESIARAAFEKRIAGPLADALIGTGGSKGFLDDAISGAGSLFGGFFADGGSPPVGLPSVVGERGPEIFVPRTAGTIVPNHNLGGTTVIVQQTIQVNPGVPELINARIREAAPVIAAQAQAAVFSEMQKGGAGARITGLRN
ncbi:hypothetical protein GobsT_50850 [Gemmata obscuriglobus]|uniref:Bacteriophage tail tape measure C-terminal domain-containing protein n=1 Tax=Gemmata obscuriglobus TaxID=114 RepID=A0A2Z3H1K7_9BACT|nr:hypothetical protein [Gemmata obscuriglobus]AWM37015.1 hypothetical protein C1280_08280 [Gemmata obscuriglobus]QEG30281.1 hypothetical protein GobsT_50850 [Gemmata obscuriglobus]VTS09605.1 Putative phage tail tape measure protein, lambda family OS=Roseomonas cervicalis ATCC 49957 GN=HMPREF0731_0150 PE=4 SV=1 [Gemmata obscuriglobus UQM 2246]